MVSLKMHKNETKTIVFAAASCGQKLTRKPKSKIKYFTFKNKSSSNARFIFDVIFHMQIGSIDFALSPTISSFVRSLFYIVLIGDIKPHGGEWQSLWGESLIPKDLFALFK